MEELESLIPKWKDGAIEDVKSHRGDGEEKKRRRRRSSRSRSRSRSPNSRRKRSRDRSRRSRSTSRDRQRNSRRSRSRDRRERKRKQEIPAEPSAGEIYGGRVTNIRDFGCFVQLEGIRKRMEGLVHISQLRDQRVKAVSDVVKRGDRVKVKVIKYTGDRVSLSMKEVDQLTGEDLNPKVKTPEHQELDLFNEAARNPDRPMGGTVGSAFDELGGSSGRTKKRISSPERWELKQIYAAGAITAMEMPDFDEETGVLQEEEDHDEDIEIELVEEEAPFLQGSSLNYMTLLVKLLAPFAGRNGWWF